MTSPPPGASFTLDGEVRAAVSRLTAAGVPSPRADAIELAAFVLHAEPAEVRRAIVLGAPLPAPQAERLAALVAERADRIPLQHLTGRAYFRNLTLQVGPGVFVPRPETESVAGWALEAARSAGPEPLVIDLCTGSGAIALAVVDELPEARVYAVELSELAHAWAARNVEALGLRVDLRCGDATSAFEDLLGAADVVVSNPPYIPLGQVPLEAEVAEHDPSIALYGGSADGLAIPGRVAARAAQLLRAGGVLVMEHADSQGLSLPRMLAASGSWAEIEDRHDLNDRPRATIARRAG